jgi:pimeloyl-ACP methyl ester carboxylesterase
MGLCSHRSGASLAAWVCLIVIVAASCGAPVSVAPEASPPATASPLGTTLAAVPSPSPSPTETDPRLAGSHALSMTTPDGVVLAGREFGDGRTGIVLAHYASEERAQTMWFSFAQLLRQRGYRVLTFNFRGYCPGGTGGCSGGVSDKVESWRDVVLAADTLRANGATKVFIMGAGLGGNTCLWAASRPSVDFAGVIGVSAPQLAIGGPSSYDLTPTILRSIKEPKLFLAGNTVDAEARNDARSMYAASVQPKALELLSSAASVQPKALELLSSAASGPELFSEGSAAYVQHAAQIVFDFLARYG